MGSLQQRIRGLSKKQQLSLAFCLGVASTLAMAPVSLWPVLFFTIPPLIWLIDQTCLGSPGTGEENASHLATAQNAGRSNGAKFWQLAAIGWAFGFGYFFVSLYWIGSSFLVEFDKFGWALPFAVTLLPAGLACFYALGFALTLPLWRSGPERLLSFSLAIFIVDWLRGHILTGFPWNLIGHSLTGDVFLMQSIPHFSIYGLSALAAFIFASPATLGAIEKYKRAQKIICIAPPLIGLFLITALYTYGAIHLNQSGPTKFKNGIELVLIQPNIAQKDKISQQGRIASLKKLLQTTNDLPPLNSAEYQQRIIIWPETAITFALNKSSEITNRLAEILPQNTTLITGAYYLSEAADKPSNDQKNNGQADKNRDLKIYNSLFVIDDEGKMISRFDKHHLVPFGEYLPFPSLFKTIGLRALAEERAGFATGPPPQPLSLRGGLSFLPSICYEAIFPLSKNTIEGGASWLLNISNDAWFGQTVGPYQHAHHVRLRAVETGLPMVRVVNGGISVIYDGLGREIKKTKLNTIDIITSKLPGAEKPPSIGVSPYISTFLIMFLILSLILIIKHLVYEKEN